LAEGFVSNQYSEQDGVEAEYDEAFVLRAVAIAHARTWSNPAIAGSLCIPYELLEKWIEEYSGKVEVRYLEDKKIKRRRLEIGKLERCPGCGADVLFEHVKGFEVRREEGFDIGTKNDIMNSGDDGIYGIKVPYVIITTELITRCPACGIYTIRNVTEKLTHSEA